MPSDFRAGDLVQTPFGKGTVRDVRNNGRIVLDVRGRAMILPEGDVSPVDERRRRPRAQEPRPEDSIGKAPRPGKASQAPSEIDLHGLTVDEALARAEAALNEALLADLAELRFIHGRSGGRIRAALHRWLGRIAAVRAFRTDPHNEGVTIAKL